LVGIGINLINHDVLTKLNATSLDRHIADTDDLKDKILSGLLDGFKLHYNAFQGVGFIPIKNIWMKHAYNRGKRVGVKFHNKEEEGIFLGIDDDGKLQLLQDGNIKLIDAGELFFI